MIKEYVLINAVPHVKTEESFVLVVLKSKPDWQKGFFNLVGGKVEPEEKEWEAAQRELKEETNLVGNGFQYMGKIVCFEGVIYCYNINVNKDDPITSEPDEPVFWMPWKHLCNDSRLLPSVRIVYPLMNAGVTDWVLDVDDSFMNESIISSTLDIDYKWKHPQFKISSILNGVEQ